ncbi:fungal specific transcription factor domain-containing protein [Colletotrichum chrysophilum]|uniref:Fungal specific transcription factor domain-containing protein n=1 Tax=Colletotrichum chrysophilum TaxID=1836956 RepID=A0AAD9AEI1_9PEZI|nr:fungal specific transcription factor domain-containing protein [Colletotrichum chrysophilum]
MLSKCYASLVLCAALLTGGADAQGANWGGFNTIRNIWTAGASIDYIGSGALTTANGPNHINYIVNARGANNVNLNKFAFPGAVTDSRYATPTSVLGFNPIINWNDQITNIANVFSAARLAGNASSRDSLFIFLGSNTGNDVLNTYNTTNQPQLITNLIGTIRSKFDQIYNAGARNFIFLSVLPAELIPLIQSRGATDIAKVADFARNYQTAVVALINELNNNTKYRGQITIFSPDFTQTLRDIKSGALRTGPTAGYLDRSGYCADVGPIGEFVPPNPDYTSPNCQYSARKYLFHDQIHFTSPTHCECFLERSKTQTVLPSHISGPDLSSPEDKTQVASSLADSNRLPRYANIHIDWQSSDWRPPLIECHYYTPLGKQDAKDYSMEDSQLDASGHEDAPDDGPEEAPEPTSANQQVTIRRAIECTHADNKPKEKRTRILITPQYERKIDQIDRRLETVIRLLHDMKVNPSAGTTSSDRSGGMMGTPPTEGMSLFSQDGPPTSTNTPSSHALQADEESSAVVEGESSLAAHSVFATEFLQKVVSTKSLQDSSLDLGETLEALSQIVTALKQQPVAGEMTYPHAKPVQRQRIQGLELPPIQKAVNTIRVAKKNHSEYDFITVNGGLYSLFTDYAAQISPEDKKEYQEVECLKNTKDDGKPRVRGMHWHQFLFWNVYYIDKSLSLRLGRASTIPDWHITMPEPSLEDPLEDPLLPYYVLWIHTAKCQGKIYEMLYSPDSMAQPYHVRQTRVHELVSMLHDVETRTQEANAKWGDRAREMVEGAFVDFCLISDSVLRLSMLTMVYRAAPRAEGSPTTFSPECIKAARAALEKHQECVSVMRKSHDVYFATYIHWTIMFAPFIPFIVLFCQVIETQDQQDLARLHGFILFLQEANTLSDAAHKMHRLFQVLYSVALRFVEFRTSTPQAQQTQASAEMDAYLAALGFPAKGGNGGNQQVQQQPQHQQHQHQMDFSQNATQASQMAGGTVMSGMGGDTMDEGLMKPGNPMMWMTNAAQLEDFLYSNQAMMDLLQEPNFESAQHP